MVRQPLQEGSQDGLLSGDIYLVYAVGRRLDLGVSQLLNQDSLRSGPDRVYTETMATATRMGADMGTPLGALARHSSQDHDLAEQEPYQVQIMEEKRGSLQQLLSVDEQEGIGCTDSTVLDQPQVSTSMIVNECVVYELKSTSIRSCGRWTLKRGTTYFFVPKGRSRRIV
jgi:hypothetical protein